MCAIIEETKKMGKGDSLGEAVHDLELAEGRLTDVRAEDAAAQQDMADMIEELKEAEDRLVAVHVVPRENSYGTACIQRVGDRVWTDNLLALRECGR
jgi:hypothetical protein